MFVKITTAKITQPFKAVIFRGEESPRSWTYGLVRIFALIHELTLHLIGGHFLVE